MSREQPWQAKQIASGPEAGKWAAFRHGEQRTKGGKNEGSARWWADLMNRVEPTQ